jgi:hypothetical protein
VPKKRKPTCLCHKPTGQARVRIDGKDHYLGEYGSAASRERYVDLIVEAFAKNGMRPGTFSPSTSSGFGTPPIPLGTPFAVPS